MKFLTPNSTNFIAASIFTPGRCIYASSAPERKDRLASGHQKTSPEIFLKTIAPYREDIVVAVECIFTWYWIADLCSNENIPFVLGYALYMKAIHCGKVKKRQN